MATSDVDTSTSTATGNGDSLSAEIDRLSLEQALRDFEVANARVIDLTQRLVAQTAETKRLRHEVETLRIEHGAVAARLNEILASRAYRIGLLIGRARRVAGSIR